MSISTIFRSTLLTLFGQRNPKHKVSAMTATTYTHIPGDMPGASFGGSPARFFWRMIEAQEQRIAKRAAKILSIYEDAELKRIGYTSADIARLRQGKSVS